MRFEPILIALIAGSSDAFSPLIPARRSVSLFAEKGDKSSYLKDMSSGKQNENVYSLDENANKNEYLEEMAISQENGKKDTNEEYTTKIFERGMEPDESKDDAEKDGTKSPYLADMPKPEVEESEEAYTAKIYERGSGKEDPEDETEERGTKSPYLKDMPKPEVEESEEAYNAKMYERRSEPEKANDMTEKNGPKSPYLADMPKVEVEESEEEYTARIYERGSEQEQSMEEAEEGGTKSPYLKDMPKPEVEESEEAYTAKIYERSKATKRSEADSEEERTVSPYLEDMSRFEKELEAETSSSVSSSDEDSLTTLLRIASSTGRGEFATKLQKDAAEDMIRKLEAQNPTSEPANSPLINGRWELLYSSTQLFRSSPFFMAGRAVCETPEQAKQYDWFCDMHRAALAISNIGQVRQIVSPTRLVSEFEVKVGSIPFLSDFTPFAYSGGLPVTIEGAIVSSADITPTDDGKSWEIYMDTVEIKGSNIPGLRQALDQGLKLGSRDLGNFLESNVASYSNPRPIFETTYLSETIRISRDQDGKVFVYGKVSDDTTSTDYSSVDSDLGIGKLLEGFNDAITKFYL